MDESGIFQIDTKGICLLCLKDCNLYDYFGGGGNRVRQEIGSCTRSVSFKMLLRYLNINLFQLCNFPPSFMESMDVIEDADIVTSLCNDCFFLIKKFSKLYENMEQIRLQLDLCVQSVYTAMQNGISQKDRVDEYERRRRTRNVVEIITAGIADQLRKETMRKCSLRIKDIPPRVSLYKRNEAVLKSSFSISLLPASTSLLSSIATAHPSRAKPGPKSKTGNSSKVAKYNQQQARPIQNSEYSDDNSNEMPPPVVFTNKESPKSQRKGKTKTGRKRYGASKSSGGGPPPIASKQGRKRKAPVEAEESISKDEFIVKVEPAAVSSYLNDDEEDDDPFGQPPEPIPIPINIINGDIKTENDDDDDSINTKKGKHNNIFPCNECSMAFDAASTLFTHQITYHSKRKIRKPMPHSPDLASNKRRLRCKICKKMFASKMSLVVHMRIHGKSNTPEKKSSAIMNSKVKTSTGVGRGRQTQPWGNIRCEYCPKFFKNRPVYQTHLTAIHSLQVFKNKLPEWTTEYQLKCAIKSACSEHNRFPTDDSKKHYGCAYCDNRFPHPSHMKLHILKRHFDIIQEKVNNLEGVEEGTTEDGDPGYEIEFDTENFYENDENSLYQYYTSNGDDGDGEAAEGEDTNTLEDENGQEEGETMTHGEENYVVESTGEHFESELMEREDDGINDDDEAACNTNFVIEEVVGADKKASESGSGEEEAEKTEELGKDGEGLEDVSSGDEVNGDDYNEEDDDQPPILMKESYSLSENVMIEQGENDVEMVKLQCEAENSSTSNGDKNDHSI